MKRDGLLYFLEKEVEKYRRLPKTDGLPEDIFLFSSNHTKQDNFVSETLYFYSMGEGLISSQTLHSVIQLGISNKRTLPC